MTARDKTERSRLRVLHFPFVRIWHSNDGASARCLSRPLRISIASFHLSRSLSTTPPSLFLSLYFSSGFHLFRTNSVFVICVCGRLSIWRNVSSVALTALLFFSNPFSLPTPCLPFLQPKKKRASKAGKGKKKPKKSQVAPAPVGYIPDADVWEAHTVTVRCSHAKPKHVLSSN